MALVIKRTWNPSGGEQVVLNHLEDLYKDEKDDAYLFHNVLLGSYKQDSKNYHSIKPDFIILDPKRGIAVIEVKDWKQFMIEGNDAILSNGEVTVNPIVKGQGYYFNLIKILNEKNIFLDRKFFKSHLVFTKKRSDPRLHEEHLQTHFSDFKETLNLDSLFLEQEMIPPHLVSRCLHVFDPVMFFPRDNNREETLAELDQKQADIVCRNPYGHYLVSGIPGSGKSIMVVSRAIFLREMFPDWKILVLTANSNLSLKLEKDIKQRDEVHESTQGKIECQTLKKFLMSHCSLEDRVVLHQIDGYEMQIDYLRSKAVANEEWDAVLVDEYQDFSDRDFVLILGCCKKYLTTINREERLTENLFLSGDKLQQIWDDGCSHSWEKIGINVRGGRGKILKESYRSPSDITNVSLEFLIQSGLGEEVKQFYEGIDDIQHINTSNDSFSFECGWDREGALIHLQVRNILAKGILPKEVLLITPPGTYFDLMRSVFSEESKQGMMIGTQFNVKGLEFPYVFIFNLGSIDYILKKSPKKKAKVVYMCITRATKQVFISSFKNEDSFELLEKIAIKKKNCAHIA